jgi:hypothetical protein
MEFTIEYVTKLLTNIHIDSYPHGPALLKIQNHQPLSTFSFRDGVRRIHRLYGQPATDPVDTLARLKAHFDSILSSPKRSGMKRDRNGKESGPKPSKKRYTAKKTTGIPCSISQGTSRSYVESDSDNGLVVKMVRIEEVEEE